MFWASLKKATWISSFLPAMRDTVNSALRPLSHRPTDQLATIWKMYAPLGGGCCQLLRNQ